MTVSHLLLLGAPSALGLGLLLWHRARVHGARVVAALLIAVVIYSMLRAGGIDAVMSLLGGERPYRLRETLISFGASSPQEMVGWALAAALAWALAERALMLAGRRATPASIVLLSALGMATISAAVEGAAIAAGWWRWSLAPGGGVPGWNVPTVALLDWGFVAFDLLLPLLVWIAGARAWRILLACTVFPLHFLSHTAIRPLFPGAPLDGYALGHLVIVVLIGAAAVGARQVTREVMSREPLWWLPAGLALMLALWTGVIASLELGLPALTSLPLAAIAASLLVLEARQERVPIREVPHPSRGVKMYRRRAAVVLLGLATGGAVLWPGAQRNQTLAEQLQQAAVATSDARWEAAEAALARAADVAPEHVGVATLRGLVALHQDRVQDAERWLEQALRGNPNARNALQLATIAALRAGRRSDAIGLARRGRETHPDEIAFLYLESVGEGRRDPVTLLALLQQAPEQRGTLVMAARLLNDRSTLTAIEAAHGSEGAGTLRPGADTD